MTDEPAMRWVQATGLPFRIEPGRQPVVVVRPVHVVLDVFLAAPDDLHRSIHLLRDLDGEDAAVDLQPSAEAAAKQMIVDLDRILRQAGELEPPRSASASAPGCRPRCRSHPCGDGRCSSSAPSPHGRGTAADRRRRAAAPRSASAFSASPSLRATTPGCFDASSSCADDVGAAHLRVRAVVPLDGGRLKSLLGRAHMVGDHGHGLVDPDHLAHALDRARRRLVQRFRLAAEHGRDGDRRDLHPRQLRVDAEFRVAIDFVRRVQPLRPRTDQGEILRILQRQLSGVGTGRAAAASTNCAIAQLARPGSRPRRASARAEGGIDAPLLGRGCDQQRAGDRAGLAQRRPEGADRGRQAGQSGVRRIALA